MIRNAHQENMHSWKFLKIIKEFQLCGRNCKKRKWKTKCFVSSRDFFFFSFSCHCLGYHYCQYHHYRHHHYLLNVVIIITIIMIICLLKLKQLLHSSIYFFRLCGVVKKDILYQLPNRNHDFESNVTKNLTLNTSKESANL